MQAKLLLTSLICVAAIANSFSQVPAYVPSNGLLGYWSFSGNANDDSENGHDGNVNGATLVSDRFSEPDKAYHFDGIDDYVAITNSDEFDFSSGLCASLWLNVTDLSSETELIVMSQQTSSSTSAVGFNISLAGSGDLNFRIGNGSLQTFSLCNISAITNEWVHVVFQYANGLQSIWLNSEFGDSNNQPNAVVGSPGVDLVIGAASWTGLNNLNYYGRIDDIGVWNRALTEDEIAALFKGCTFAEFEISGPIAPVRFTNEVYSYPATEGSSYHWIVENGVIISGQGTNQIEVLWSSEGSGSVSIVETNAGGCTNDPVTLSVVVIPTSVLELSDSSFQLFPIPFSNSLRLTTSVHFTGSSYLITDLTGRTVSKGTIGGSQIEISTEDFCPGIYQFTVLNGNRPISQRIVKV